MESVSTSVKNLENGNHLLTFNLKIKMPEDISSFTSDNVEIRVLPRDPRVMLQFLPTIKQQLGVKV
jgi:hypothetical protein